MSIRLPNSGASRSDLVFWAIWVEELVLHSLVHSQYCMTNAIKMILYLLLKLINELRILFFETIVEQD